MNDVFVDLVLATYFIGMIVYCGMCEGPDTEDELIIISSFLWPVFLPIKVIKKIRNNNSNKRIEND